jgi:hypothetical protein
MRERASPKRVRAAPSLHRAVAIDAIGSQAGQSSMGLPACRGLSPAGKV